jgi:hypothetical protein
MRSIERPPHRSHAAIAETRRRSRLVLALAGWAALAGCAAGQVPPAAGPPAPAPGQGTTVLLVSDLHFSPYAAGTDVVRRLRVAPVSAWAGILAASADTAPSPYGKDSNYALLRSAGAAMRAAVPHPAFVVVTGDFLAHNFETSYTAIFGDTATAGAAAFADSTMAFMALWMSSLVPADVPVYPSIGNNDSGCGDYGMDTQFQRSAARSWAPLAQRGGGAPGFVAAFDSGGYYTARPPAAGVTLVMMNDVYWSRSYDPACGPDRGDAELAWLGHTLDSVRAQRGRAWLAAHIPPGIDIYSSLKGTPVLMMDTSVAARYDSTVLANADVVALQLTGHTHMNEFRVYATGAGGVPDVGIPAVTPLFYNNPGFLAMRLGPSGDVLDYTAYALTRAQAAPGFPAGWGPLFDFGATYRQSAVTGAALLSAATLIARDSTVRAAWERNYSGGSAGQNPTPSNWISYWCGIRNLDASSFQACLQAGAGTEPAR